MSKTVTFRQLRKALSDLGFESAEHGSHVLFRHTKTGAVLTVPNNTDFVREIYVNTAIRQVANSGITTASNFEVMIGKSER